MTFDVITNSTQVVLDDLGITLSPSTTTNLLEEFTLSEIISSIDLINARSAAQVVIMIDGVEFTEDSLFNFVLSNNSAIIENSLRSTEAINISRAANDLAFNNFQTKVDKVAGKGLSTEDYTTESKTLVDGFISRGYASGEDVLDDMDSFNISIYNLESSKVDKVAGKGLSTEDFTTAEKDKLANLSSSTGGGSGTVYLAPYINSVSTSLVGSTNNEIIVRGEYFTLETTFSILTGFPGNITNTQILSPSEAVITVNTVGSVGGQYEVQATTGTKVSTDWNSPKFFVVETTPRGAGSAGTFTTNFDLLGIGSTSFAGWTQLGTRNWQVKSNGTSSGNTGPSGAINGANYIYSEVSSPVTTGDNFIIQTENFSLLTKIDFLLHRYGGSMGDLFIEGSVDGTTWNVIKQYVGANATGINALWVQETIDVPSESACSYLRFRQEYGGSYTGDCAIDNIIITSI